MGSGFIPTNHAPKGTALISLALKRRVLRAGWIKRKAAAEGGKTEEAERFID
jgi:hypothetical protein